MRLRYTRYFKLGMFLIVGLLVLTGPGFAQDSEMTDPLDLSDQLIVLEYSVAATTEPPSFEMLSDGRGLLTVIPSGPISGDLDGSMTTRVTQIEANDLDSFAVTFTIETADGRIEGYYVGSLHAPAGISAAPLNAYGQILSVTGVYANLFLAEVFVSGQVPVGPNGVGTGENGTLIISPR